MPIETPEEFENWLKDQPQETCSLIAARAALRVFPMTFVSHAIAAENKVVALLVARAILTAAVAAKTITPEVRAAAKSAYDAVDDGADAAGEAGAAAVYAADTAITNHAPTRLSVTAAAVEAAAAAAAGAAARAAAYADSSLDFDALFSEPLWYSPGEPDWLVSALSADDNVLESGPEWAFWRDWYQGFLIGKPLDWEFQRRVALIDAAIWEAGPEAVAEEIERIRAEWLVEKLPQAERVEFNPETAKFFTVPIEIAKPDLLAATLTQVEDALEDALANSSNGLHDRSREVRVLRRIATKYGNNPQQIEMGFVGVHAGLTRQILSEELPPSEENLTLQAAVEEGARAIRATHPEVAENRKILNEQVIRELPEGAKEKLEEALPVLRAISEPELADDWDHDIPMLINDATGPLPSGAPALPGADEATRIFSRAAKISLHLKLADVIHKVDGSAGYKAARIITTIATLVMIGLTIL